MSSLRENNVTPLASGMLFTQQSGLVTLAAKKKQWPQIPQVRISVPFITADDAWWRKQ